MVDRLRSGEAKALTECLCACVGEVPAIGILETAVNHRAARKPSACFPVRPFEACVSPPKAAGIVLRAPTCAQSLRAPEP